MTRAGAVAAGVVQRKVYFYRCRLVGDEGSEARVDPEVIREAVERCNAGGDRYQELEDGEATCVWTGSVGGRVALRLGGVRRSGLPRIEEGGAVLPLAIRDGQGLVEETHLVCFEDGIVGVEFNFYGPRLSRLARFLREKCPDVPRFAAEILLNQDAAEQVEHLRDIRLIQLRCNRAYLDLLEQASESLPGSLAAAAENLGGRSLELVIRPEPRSRRSLGGAALEWVRSLAGNPRTKEGADVLKVRGLDERTARVELVDLLRDELVSARRLVQRDRRHRGVEAEQMFQEIAAAYAELRDAIRRAAGLEG